MNKRIDMAFDLDEIIQKRSHEKGYTTPMLLAYFSLTFVGTLAMKGYSEEFFEKTLDRMREDFNKKCTMFKKERKDIKCKDKE